MDRLRSMGLREGGVVSDRIRGERVGGLGKEREMLVVERERDYIMGLGKREMGGGYG